jgi:hypothetical protein
MGSNLLVEVVAVAVVTIEMYAYILAAYVAAAAQLVQDVFVILVKALHGHLGVVAPTINIDTVDAHAAAGAVSRLIRLT